MEKAPLVSVIVPIYKVEAYVERCINSILRQKHNNFELILVDDGSPDRCGEICDVYAEKDERIKVVHKRNGGLSDARNAGLEICKGDFVVFVDSDDWVSEQYLEQMLHAQKETSCDIVECNIIRTEEFILNEVEKNTINYVEYNTVHALKLLIQDTVFHQHVWNKLYRREVIQGIMFEKGKINEDEFWTYQVFGQANKIVLLDMDLYYYFQRSNSIMGSGYSIRRLDAIEAKLIRQCYIEKKFPELAKLAKVNLIFSCIYAGQMMMKYLNSEERTVGIEYLTSVIKQLKYDGSYFGSKKAKIWGICAKYNFKVVCLIRNFMNIGF